MTLFLNVLWSSYHLIDRLNTGLNPKKVSVGVKMSKNDRQEIKESK